MSNRFPKRAYSGPTAGLQDEMERAFARLKFDGGDATFTSASPSSWAGTPPSSLSEAIDRLAYHVASGAGAVPIVELP